MTQKFTTHYNRKEAESVTAFADAALVSIYSSDGSPAKLKRDAWIDVLSLSFDDISKGEYIAAAMGYRPPAVWDAEKIAAFIRKHWNKSIVAHCDAGISRSAAVAKVLKGLGWNYRVPEARQQYALTYANPILVRHLEKRFDKAFA